LNWTSNGARWCWSRGQFGGSRPLQGSFTTPAISQDTWFSVVCSDGDRQVSDEITVVVTDAPGGGGSGEVSVSLTADPSEVRPGGTSTLRWSSQNADSCTAGGAWSGSRPQSGQTGTGPLSDRTSYRLTCARGAETAVSSVAVDVQEVPLVRWQAPTRNEDGSNLTDLAGYWLYWGRNSRDYTGRVRIWNASQTQYRPEQLSSGDYFVAVTALNRDGEESGYSNEARIDVP
jgi:hypothetical protein